MSPPTGVVHTDSNGIRHECVAEAFDTSHNIIILLYPVQALTKTTIILPDALPGSVAGRLRPFTC